MNDALYGVDKYDNREIWVDNVKVIACIFVVSGHFFQSMTKSGIVPANEIYHWFNQIIYFFPVQLFFVCSGYLYQKYSCVNSVYSWGKNILKKALVLGTPYLVFSSVTWLLKTIFAKSVNEEIGGLFYTLFLSPASPYWYLYCLFFIFLFTPTFSNRMSAWIGLCCAAVLKVVNFGGITVIYAVSSVIANEIWFVIGMCLGGTDFMHRIQKKQHGFLD